MDQIEGVMGHSQIMLTLKFYQHAIREFKQFQKKEFKKELIGGPMHTDRLMLLQTILDLKRTRFYFMQRYRETICANKNINDH